LFSNLGSCGSWLLLWICLVCHRIWYTLFEGNAICVEKLQSTICWAKIRIICSVCFEGCRRVPWWLACSLQGCRGAFQCIALCSNLVLGCIVLDLCLPQLLCRGNELWKMYTILCCSPHAGRWGSNDKS
jgi:hypothetical protein